MGTNTISIREDAYERLKARKRENESFSDLIDRLIDERLLVGVRNSEHSRTGGLRT